ncbi:hypothetical protein SAMN05216480_1235 [Pustulibacterium marinum]|uniref:Uncharacterized protein n=1 Tax=Pustulibacterium marinum TaxID=1224947 RepID=A0A1I7IVS8_9FLAO|nr:hypothetical protein [Pustulibacterium marinum]SFU76999.1 hypothetical protein SAMN05216480_1235 [Pustulibacterium marinum]
MNKQFTKEELLKMGGIIDSKTQIRIVHDLGTSLYTEYFYSCGYNKFEFAKGK